ncbi:MAG: hypothetical protein MK214_16965 [Thalassotalea sp.]|nr:hypothetical protein [Thalassotalea sp.]
MASKEQNKSGTLITSPLAVIVTFVTFTEVVTGIVVTQAAGWIQVALTAFVIVFPVGVAWAFFYILWHKNYVFYPPSDFGGGTDVHRYVEAMQRQSLDQEATLNLYKESIEETISILSENETEAATSAVEAVSERASDSFKKKVVTIDASSINGQSWVIPYDPERLVQDFVDPIWAQLSDHFDAYQYGNTWCLKDKSTGKLLKDLGSYWARRNHEKHDYRTLKEVNISSGDQLTIHRLN